MGCGASAPAPNQVADEGPTLKSPEQKPAVLNLERRLVKQAALVVAKPDPTPCVRGVQWVRPCLSLIHI